VKSAPVLGDKRRVCAIHQPNFFPWLGYFDKIRRADVFVFLDAVAYPKSGNSMGSWCNRVRLEIGGQPRWVGCAVVREHGVQLICDVRIDDRRPWRRKLLRTLEIHYRRSPNYGRAMPVIESLIMYPEDNLARFNMRTVGTLCALLHIDAQFRRQSELAVAGHATTLLVGLTRGVGADTYVCGGGANGYQDDAAFAGSGVRLVYQEYQPLPYGKTARFLPGLSVIDYLMKGPVDAFDW